ncbi:MAG: hypothetical protein CVU07_07440, partial [Bacteroidetes bacterium HGW-Bacteroidetes-23]
MSIYLVLFYVANMIGFVPCILVLKYRLVINNFKGIVFYAFLVGFASFYELLFSHILKVNVENWFKFYSI